ncbi:MAG: M28 family peptidase [candidate division Zixibacteria bacterium]|nr:M28 family peptidase [candidate division Zixibacteria bacterium]
MNGVFSRCLYIMCAVAVVAATGCGSGGNRPPAFDGNRALTLLQQQVALGPRTPGSESWQAFQTMLRRLCDSLGIAGTTQVFTYNDYLTGNTISLANWIVSINPGERDRVLVAAHYDSRPRADRDPDSTRRNLPIPGANDGASGSAMLMHLMELLSTHPPRIGVDLVFFDGEDYGPSGKLDQYLLGSTYFAAHSPNRYRYGILLDMIGDRDLRIYREGYSERYAWEIDDKVWKTAARLGATAFVDSVGTEVIDDHIPLVGAGIPMIDIIDFDYPYWHTTADTPDKCSAASLEAVGRVVMEVIYGE